MFQCVIKCEPHAGYIQRAYNIDNGKSGTFLVSFSALSKCGLVGIQMIFLVRICKMQMDPAESQPKYTKQLGTVWFIRKAKANGGNLSDVCLTAVPWKEFNRVWADLSGPIVLRGALESAACQQVQGHLGQKDLVTIKVARDRWYAVERVPTYSNNIH